MRPISPARGRTALATALILILLGLAGCGGAPERPAEPVPLPEPEVTPLPADEISLELPPSAFSDTFRRAEEALSRFEWMIASDILDELPDERDAVGTYPLTADTIPGMPATPSPYGDAAGIDVAAPLPALSPDDRVYRDYLEARIDYVRGDQAAALARLDALDRPGVNPALEYRARNLRRHILTLSGDHLASARLTDLMLRTAPREHRAALRRGIWHDLQRLDNAALREALAGGADPQWRGWLELSLLGRGTIAEVPVDLAQWRYDNPEHPAAESPPGGLGYLEQATPANRVALLLPLSGRLAPAGKAVLDGYLAAWFAARADGVASHSVIALDLTRYGSVLEAYDDALAQGAGLVVGPLSKGAVEALAARPLRPLPVLALNRGNGELATGSTALVQLALAPEDEAEGIAQYAYGSGARRALVIRPEGAWGDKMEQALRGRWDALGGTVANTVSYGDREAYSAVVKSGLGLDASEARARNIRDILATSIEFNARRRQDLDAIFLLSRSGAEARSIKPLLAFHYAGSVPVYAPSSIYSGIPDSRDRDLDGVNLVEMPWLLGANPELRVTLAAGDTGSDSYTRLNALGADAFLVQSRFVQLQAGPDALIRGHSGLLTMDPALQLHRELWLATFDGGDLRAR
jgi:outer membrane PBP1 activator LpoA protein